MQNAKFKLMLTIDAEMCLHLMFQISSRKIEWQNNYRNFVGDRLAIWLCIYES